VSTAKETKEEFKRELVIENIASVIPSSGIKTESPPLQVSSLPVERNTDFHADISSQHQKITKEDSRCFLLSKDPLILRASIPKDEFKIGEVFSFGVTIDNQTSVKVTGLKCFIEKIDASKVRTKLGKSEYQPSGEFFPMKKGVLEMKEDTTKFLIPSYLEPSGSGGLEYEFVCKCQPQAPYHSLKLKFPITLKR